jgi:hypothetical protein
MLFLRGAGELERGAGGAARFIFVVPATRVRM